MKKRDICFIMERALKNEPGAQPQGSLPAKEESTMQIKYPDTAEQWGVWEISLEGRTDGNPFTDYPVTGVFTSKNETKQAEGFYDGNGIYKVRFMP